MNKNKPIRWPYFLDSVIFLITENVQTVKSISGIWQLKLIRLHKFFDQDNVSIDWFALNK